MSWRVRWPLSRNAVDDTVHDERTQLAPDVSEPKLSVK